MSIAARRPRRAVLRESSSPLWAKPMIGVIGSSQSTFNSINNALGGVRVRRTYHDDASVPSSWANSEAASDVAAGRASIWSWKPNVTGFPGSTSQKNAFSNFLDTIPAGHQAIICAVHEPEDNIADGDYTLTQWGALQDAVHTITKSKGRPELRTGVCFMGPWTFDSRSGRASWDWDGCMD